MEKLEETEKNSEHAKGESLKVKAGRDVDHS